MGNNTVALFLNDRTGDIEREPDRYVRRLVRALRSGGGDDDCGGMQVLPSQHADTVQIIAVGANRARSIGYAHWQDGDERLLRKLADQHGYRLVRKSAPPTDTRDEA